MLGKTGTLTKPETAFSPAAIPGFALWLVGNKSPVTMNGSNVSQCNDISGNGNHATQGTATKQPPLGMISGLPAIDFTGDNLDVLSIAATTSINNIWTGGAYIALVVNVDQVKDPAEFERFLHKDSASSDGWFLDIGGVSGGNGSLLFLIRHATTAGGWVTMTFPIVSGATQIIELWYDSDDTDNNPTILVNGATMTLSEFSAPDGAAKDDSGNPLLVGNSHVSTNDLDGKIAEIVVYTSIPNADERLTLRSHLAAQYGVTLS